MRTYTYGLSCLIFLGVLSGPVLAQSPEAQKTLPKSPKFTSEVWRESVANLKKSAQALLNNNDQLTAENDKLRSASFNLKTSIEEALKENDRLKDEPARLNKLIVEEDQKAKVLQKEIKVLNEEITALGKQCVSLKGELSKIEEKQKPWAQQAVDLKTKQLALELDLKFLQSSPDAGAQKLKDEIENVRAAIERVQQKTKEIQEAVKKDFIDNPASVRNIQKIKQDNRTLSSELREAKRMLADRMASGEAFDNKNLNIRKSDEDLLGRKTAEKIMLEEQGQRLAAKIREVTNESVSPPPGGQGEAQDLDELQQENSALKKKISDATEVIMTLQRESSIAQALLDTPGQVSPATKSVTAAESAGVYEAMGYAFAAQGEYEKAIQQYKIALQEGGNKKNIYFNLGYIYYKMGNIAQAIKNYKNVLKIDPHDEDARRNLNQMSTRPSP